MFSDLYTLQSRLVGIFVPRAVQVKRDGAVIDGSAPNNGNYSDLLGKKVSNSYVYEVCEIPAGACATDALQF